MIIDNCYRLRAFLSPTKNDSPLVIDADRVPALPFAFESLQSVTGRNSQVEELFSRINGGKLARGHASNSGEVRLPSVWKSSSVSLSPKEIIIVYFSP